VKEGYGGEGGLREGHSTGDGGLIWGLLDLQREVEFWSGIVSVRHRGCWRFWARGPGYPYDILELGSYLVGRVELGFGQCLQCSNGQEGKARTNEGY
jgi:hypothetical protein